MLCYDVKRYIKECDICLTSKTICYKPYNDLQSLTIFIYHWKDLSMDFVTNLPISTNSKENSYDSILIIINWLTKMVYYKLIKVIINIPGLVKVIINMVMRHHNLANSIIIDQQLLFSSKF